MQKKKGQPNRTPLQLSSEKKPSDLFAHELLAHEDKDPIYPFEPVKNTDSKKQGLSKADRKDKHKKRSHDKN